MMLWEILLAILTATLPPCAAEDATTCYWDAAAHGNGAGVSFIDLGGNAYYLEG